MISRHSTKQPSHPIPGYPTRDASSKKPTDEVCLFCQNEVFNADMHRTLVSSQSKNLNSVSLKYCQTAQDLHGSVLAHCKWCQSVMSGILTAAHLDYWTDRWNGSHSDGSSMGDDQEEDQDMNEEEVKTSNSGKIDSGSDVDESSHELTLSLQDFEKNRGALWVEVKFIKKDSSNLYSMIEVTAELSWESYQGRGDLLSDLTGEKSVNLTFEAFTQPGPCQSRLFPSLPEPIDLGSDLSFQLARAWITECERHEKCQTGLMESPVMTSNDFPRIPRHLIGVSHAQGPRIVNHQCLPQTVGYVALSYVWGTNQKYVLTKATLDEKRSGLDLAQLPRTIIDAIEVTQRLGYKYLWVDALCIVQDAGEEMKEELSVMGQIYRDSDVTIIAANSSSSADGFLKVSEPPTFSVDLFDVPTKTERGSVNFLTAGYRSYYKPFKDPINSRAWTLQERVLATRCLIYSHDGLKWCCKTCEKNPSSPADAPLMFPRMLPRESSGKEMSDDIHQAWLNILTEYTSRKLTYGKDKLAAISAIAFEISKQSGWTYLAGIWKEHLFLDLQWRRDPQSATSQPGYEGPTDILYPRSSEYRAPSWSWASIDSSVVDASEGGDPRDVFHFRILSCEVEYSNVSIPAKFNFEPVRCGVLVLEARMIELGWRLAESGDMTDIFLLDPDDKGVVYICGEARFDAEEHGINAGMKVHCLAMSILSYENRRVIPVEGLLLVRETNDGMFRRIGFFKLYSKDMFDNVRGQIVQIV